MRKNRKLLSLLVVIVTISLLSGCVAGVHNVSINADGSGSCTIYLGYEEDIYNQIKEETGVVEQTPLEGLTSSTYEPVEFTYNEKKYIGDVASFNFKDLYELNETFLTYGENIVKAGTPEFSIADDGKITFTLTTNEAEENTTLPIDPEDLTEEDLAMLERAEDMVMVYDINFPSAVKMTSTFTTEAITVTDNNVFIDYMKLAEETDGFAITFTFETEANKNYVPAPERIRFTDVGENDWFYKQITEMVEMDLFDGKGNGLFCPKDTMTKAEFITVAARLLYDKVTLNLAVTNPDVWWEKYYNVCIEDDIFTEEELERISMDDGMQRQEMALVAFRLIEHLEGFDLIDVSKYTEKIPDYDKVDENLKYYVGACYSLGILGGADKDGSFKPKDTLTRAEASTVIYRIVEESARIQNK